METREVWRAGGCRERKPERGDHWQIPTRHTHIHTVSSQGDSQYPSIIILSRCPNAYRLPPVNLTTDTHTRTHSPVCRLHCSGKGQDGLGYGGRWWWRGQKRTVRRKGEIRGENGKKQRDAGVEREEGEIVVVKAVIGLIWSLSQEIWSWKYIIHSALHVTPHNKPWLEWSFFTQQWTHPSCMRFLRYIIENKHLWLVSQPRVFTLVYVVCVCGLQLVVPVGLFYSHWSIPYRFLAGSSGHQQVFCHTLPSLPLCFGYQLFVGVCVGLQKLDPVLPQQFSGQQLLLWKKVSQEERNYLVSSRGKSDQKRLSCQYQILFFFTVSVIVLES